jgi:hypothetical protein
VEKEKFDDLLGKLLKAKPEPRKKINTQGRRRFKDPDTLQVGSWKKIL